MDQQPEYIDCMRRNLTDDVYRRMVDNPDERIPFLVNWPRVQSELTDA